MCFEYSTFMSTLNVNSDEFSTFMQEAQLLASIDFIICELSCSRWKYIMEVKVGPIYNGKPFSVAT